MDEKEGRKDSRIKTEMPEFIRAELRVGKTPDQERVFDLRVANFSKYGLGLLVSQKDLDLLDLINEGDKLTNLSFFAKLSMIKVDGTVRHKTEIVEGKYKGHYLIGIESPDLMEM